METVQLPRKIARRDCHAQVAVVRVAEGRGLAALRLIDDAGTASEHFVPFNIDELPSQKGRDYLYAGIIAALDRLHALEVRRVLIQIDDAGLVDEIERRSEPHRDLTLPYIMVGCKLNAFAHARLVAVPPDRLSALRTRASALGSTLYRSVA
jgi:hypothetical protein